METIATHQLFLTPICDKHIDSLFDIYNDERNMTFIPPRQHSASRSELAKKYKTHFKNGSQLFAVKLSNSNKVIGEAGFFNSFKNHNKLEIGYIIAYPYWNRGFGTEICRGLITYGFQQLHLENIHARMYTKNIASILISKKCGMQKINEGLDSHQNKFCHYQINKKQFYTFQQNEQSR